MLFVAFEGTRLERSPWPGPITSGTPMPLSRLPTSSWPWDRLIIWRCTRGYELEVIFTNDERFLRTRSIQWLLMPWLLASPGHQRPYYWARKVGWYMSSITIHIQTKIQIEISVCLFRFFLFLLPNSLKWLLYFFFWWHETILSW